MEYTHPLADVIGKREAPPIMDGRVKTKDNGCNVEIHNRREY